MVQIEKHASKGALALLRAKLPGILFAAVIGIFLWWCVSLQDDSASGAFSSLTAGSPRGASSRAQVSISVSDATSNIKTERRFKKTVTLDQETYKPPVPDLMLPRKVNECPVMKISDLSPEEQHPKANSRYMVTPPEGGLMHLLCCHTTKGPFNALVHEEWAPIGAKRILDMVQSGYFNSKNGVPMMRCIKNFLCQFGLNSDPKLSKEFKESIQDDTNWLPEGPKHRKNKDGVIRFAQGYLAYAGGGPNTRDNQLIVSLVDVEALAGGSPWEVPWGELVGKHSFKTLSKIYYGYGEGTYSYVLAVHEQLFMDL